jgi:hypothetical protein
MDVFHLGKELFLGAENTPDNEPSVEILYLWKHLCDLHVVILLKPHTCNFKQHFVDFCNILPSLTQNLIEVLCSFTDMTKRKPHSFNTCKTSPKLLE